jgi:hypothetical protein
MMGGSRAIAVEAARNLLGLSLDQLWVDYFTLGGSLSPNQIKAFLSGEHPLVDHDHDLLVHALNEHFIDQGKNHPLGYADELATDPT